MRVQYEAGMIDQEPNTSSVTPSISRKRKQDSLRSMSAVFSFKSVLRQASRLLSGQDAKEDDSGDDQRQIWTCDIANELEIDCEDDNKDIRSERLRQRRPLRPEQQSNVISTTKYTLVSWLPVSIFEQFKRVANFYFLVISILMVIGSYFPSYYETPLDADSTAVPLVFVLLVSSFKEGYEDYERYRSDCVENQSEVIVCTYDRESDVIRETRKPSSKIRCGDIIKLVGGAVVPADIVLLHSSTFNKEADLGSQCYVETSNIDGETNLKLKEAPSVINTLPLQETSSNTPPKLLFDGHIEYEEPSKNIHNFIGALTFNAFPDIHVPLSISNLLLRSSIFSNTEWGYGVAVYTGQTTKVSC